MPADIREQHPETADAFYHWMVNVMDAVAPFASLFKPQDACWRDVVGGTDAMRALISYAKEHYPDIPVFIDCKPGDIDRTQFRNARTQLVLADGDGMNYNGYMGESTLGSLVKLGLPGRSFVGLGRTSNPEAWEVQDVLLADGRMLWEKMVGHTLEWSRKLGVLDDAGVVMGAAYPENPNDPASRIISDHLVRCRRIVGTDLWILAPGIGKQGGAVRDTVLAGYAGAGSIGINSSSGLSESPNPAGAAEVLRDQMRAALGRPIA